MPRLTLLPSNTEIEVRHGTRLSDAIRSAGLPIAAPCGDDLICAKCAVRIVSGDVTRESRVETEMKQRNRVDPALRLACGLRIRDDLVVTADYWGGRPANVPALGGEERSADPSATTRERSARAPAPRADDVRDASERAWLLIDHGSRRPEAHTHLVALADELRRRCPGRAVYVAHMELAEPTLDQTIAACIAAGHRTLDIYPFFLAPGRHVTRDLPEQIARAKRSHPELTLNVLPALGEQQDFADWVVATLRAAERSD